MRELLAPVLQAGAAASGWKVISWDHEQGICITLGRGGESLLVELEPRNEALPCYTRTRWLNVSARRRPEGQDLGPDERKIVDGIVKVVAQRETRLALVEAPRREEGARTRVREVQVTRMLVAEGDGRYYLNPYGGCMVGCGYCYVSDRADLSQQLDGQAVAPWGQWLDVKVNAAEVLRREVRELAPGVVRMSPILTDPYQPVEKHYRITRACLEVLVEAGFSPVVLTRMGRIVEDLPILAAAPGAAVGLSIPTDRDDVRLAFEPRADSIDERLEALRAARQAGLRTFAVIQPVLSMEPDRLVALVAPYVHAVRIDRMHRMDRAHDLYASAGQLEAASDVFFRETIARLVEGFAARGVGLDPLDDVAARVVQPADTG